MTLMEVVNQLFIFFIKHNRFCLEEHFREIISNTDNVSEDTALVIRALEELVSNNLVVELKYADKKVDKRVWILKKPLMMNEQQVVVGPEVAAGIAQALNNFSRITNDDNFACNVLEITNNDLRNLLHVLATILEENNKPTDDSPET